MNGTTPRVGQLDSTPRGMAFLVRVVSHGDVAADSEVEGPGSRRPLYIPDSATLLAACHRPGGVTLNGTSATPPRAIPKEVMKPVRSDEVAQMVAPTRFDHDFRSHSHLPIADFRFGNV